MDNQRISQKAKDLIIARLGVVDVDLQFTDGGSDDSYSRDEMIQLIRDGDPVGLEFVKTEFEFLQAIKSGDLMRALTTT